jgi:NAD(P)H-dependent FMN reductase
MYNLSIIIASTRPGRKGPAMANWIYEVARQHEAFNVELIDLLEVNLPFLDEPLHPRLQKYEHQHTRDWSAKINKADAFIFVTPEYNYGYTAPLKNALDFVFNEWSYKPIGFVSYGGIAGGTRCIQLLKPVVTALKMVPVMEAVNIPFFTKHINEEGKFIADEPLINAANAMLRELAKWVEPLQKMRG